MSALLCVAPATGAQAAPLGVNGRIAFSSLREGQSDIFKMDPSGSFQTNLTSGSDWGDSPSWSPDGRRIAFFGSVGGKIGLFTMDPNGNRTRRVAGPVFDPAWSPDGSMLAAVDYDPNRGTSRIIVVSVAGSSRTLLPRGSTLDEHPSWSPDGRKIAFDSQETPGSPYNNWEIYVSNSDGSGRAVNITNDPDVQGDPSWSPDGTKIAFDGDPLGVGIYTMNPDGTDLQLVESDSSAVDGRPAWSPDGSRIAFQRQAGQTSDIYVMDDDGSNVIQLTTSGSDYAPDWQPVCTLMGTPGNDMLVGTSGHDLICGLRGNDTIYGLAGSDVIFGGEGDDRIDGGFGKDVLVGGTGADYLYGGSQGDLLSSTDGSGGDRANGADGVDLCWVDAGDLSKSC